MVTGLWTPAAAGRRASAAMGRMMACAGLLYGDLMTGGTH